MPTVPITPGSGGTRRARAGSVSARIGDVTIGRWPQHYITQAKVLKPIQVKVHGAFHRGDPMGVQQRMDHAASLA